MQCSASKHRVGVPGVPAGVPAGVGGHVLPFCNLAFRIPSPPPRAGTASSPISFAFSCDSAPPK